MRLNAKEVELFKALSTSGTGNLIKDYLLRLTAELCDIRNMDGVSEAERLGRLEAVKIIEKHLIDRITFAGQEKKTNNAEYI